MGGIGPPYRKLGLVLLVLVGVAIALSWAPEAAQRAIAEAVRTKSHPSPTISPTATAASGNLPKSRLVKDPSRSEEAWLGDSSDPLSSFYLALDEAMVRDGDGQERLVALNPPATLETLTARIAEVGGGQPAFPVGYLEGQPRSLESRRVVTGQLRLRIAPEQAKAMAAAYGLTLAALPDYAPGWAIFNAAGPLAALKAVENLRADGQQSAGVLLATNRAKRALPNDPLINDQWHLNNGSLARTHVNIEAAWNYGGSGGVKGTGIRVGVVDDGLQTAHPDLVANVDATNDNDWNGGDSDPNPGTGDDHGTSCAGNVAARGNNGIGVSGTAPEATLVGLRLIAASVTDAQEAEAMSWKNDIIQIKSNSWGPSDTGTILETAGPLTQAAWQTAVTSGRGGRGTIFLWAAGNGGHVNDNSNYDGYANAIQTIAIGATDSAGNRAYYSEPGANVVVCAPSSGTSPALGITTVDRTGSNGYNTASSASGGDYTNDFGGTSSATPTAAGIVALMLERNPNLGWRDVQEILIRSAFKFKPTDGGWASNGAGLAFNHDFGAGLIDATAALNLAATWTNLAGQTSVTSTQSSLSVAIPENNATGITRTFDFSASNLRVEHVTVRLSATHTARGNLEIVLTAPGGMASRLAEVRPDTGDNYTDWTFSSVRHWGESSTGNWSLKIADRSASGNSTGGTLTLAEVKIYGTSATPVNPAPQVRIDSPAAGSIFSPGGIVPVQITAEDLTVSGAQGTVTQVQLLVDGALVGTDNAAPYQFSITPAPGAHDLMARATDSEGAVGNSASVSIVVVNQAPVITAANLNVTGTSYTDTPLSVSNVSASDPEGGGVVLSYQWQASTDGVSFADVPGATQVTLAASAPAGKLWRCVVTASDGEQSGTAFVTAAVNLLLPPPTSAVPGSSISYSGGLVLRGTGSTVTRGAIINEFSQGSGTSEWIELLTLRDGSLAYWDLTDAAGNILVFLDDPVWDRIPAGTLIVVYNGLTAKDSLLPADDLDPSDGRMILSSANVNFFDPTFDTWLPLGNSGDSIFLSDADASPVHELAYGSSTAATPNVGAAGSGKAAYYASDSDSGANLASNWTVTTSLSSRALASRALLPGVALSGSSYSENFDATPGASGTAYPDGWTAYNGGTEDSSMTVGSSTSTAGANYNYASRIGLLGSGSGFETSSLVLALRNTTGLTALQITYDVIKIREQPRSHDFKLQYSLTSATSGFVDVPSGTYTSGTIAQGTVTLFNASLPTAVENQSSTVYLRWLYTPSATPGTGARDGLALDNVTLSWNGNATGGGGSGGGGGATLTGVTPGAPNSPQNSSFVTALRSGLLASPALYRLGSGTNLPTGLSLNANTGLLSGTVATSNPPGSYPIVIERYNSLGETVSHSFTLSLAAGGYLSWISGFNVGSATGRSGDFDQDGLGNAVEQWLGSLPYVPNAGLISISATETTVVFQHSRANNLPADVTAQYQWSSDLVAWSASGVTNAQGVRVHLEASVLQDLSAPANDLVQVTATIVQGSRQSLFVRLVVP
jgi:subtilisin-like proprotein convertase family protein